MTLPRKVFLFHSIGASYVAMVAVGPLTSDRNGWSYRLLRLMIPACAFVFATLELKEIEFAANIGKM
jgi:hypothetical protein